MSTLLVLLFILVLPCAGWAFLAKRQFRRLHLSGFSLAHHLETMPTPMRFGVIEHEGSNYLRIEGPSAYLTAPPGPPMYVFDKSGKLVDWTSDAVDDHSFLGRWPGIWNSNRELTREMAEEWTLTKQ